MHCLSSDRDSTAPQVLPNRSCSWQKQSILPYFSREQQPGTNGERKIQSRSQTTASWISEGRTCARPTSTGRSFAGPISTGQSSARPTCARPTSTGGSSARRISTGQSLSKADLSEADLRGAVLRGAVLIEADLTGANLRRANLGWAFLRGAFLTSANLTSANLKGANLREAKLILANLTEANLSESNLTAANLTAANLSGAKLNGAVLNRSQLVRTDMSHADLTGSSIYGIAAWNVRLTIDTRQENLLITPPGEAGITVDNINVAQFIYLLLNNEEVRAVIDTITSKTALILGRFSPERKIILDRLREELRKRHYVPIMFDFEKPRSRDTIETIRTLAGMFKFIIADLTDAKAVVQELQAIVPNLPSVAVRFIIKKSESEPAMFDHIRRYPWVLDGAFEYENPEEVIKSINHSILEPWRSN
jgi:hypothetical protein